MKTKELVIMALFAAIGAVLHSIMPPVLFGMKPDMMLVMMFMGILLFPPCAERADDRDCNGNHFRTHDIFSGRTASEYH
ncbi:tryptophan transporter [Bacillus velezensis]